MKTNHILKAIILVSIIILTSCAQKNAVKSEQDDIFITFKSEKNIICKLTKDTSPALLAQKFLGDGNKAWMIEDANEKALYHSGETIVIPLINDNKAGLFKKGYQTVPILCYHRFSKNCSSQLCMPEDVFARQMKYLKDNNYRVISMKMLQEYLEYKKPLPKKAVVITIDDGYRSVYEIAFPILEQYDFTATLFIYTDFVAGGSAMTWDQIREMKNKGFEIGSHTLSHADLAAKKSNENEKDYIRRITREIVGSKKILDERLNQDTQFFAFPFGSSNQQIINICKETGYKTSATVSRGANPFFQDPFLVHRDQILSRKQEKFISRLKTLQLLSLEEKKND